VNQRNQTFYLKTRQNEALVAQIFYHLKEFARREKIKRNDIHELKEHIAQANRAKLEEKYFSILKQYQLVKAQQRQKEDYQLRLAEDFCYFHLLQKNFCALKKETRESVEKSKYSRLYSLFVAWKFFVKEKTLLKKYLQECNYQEPKKCAKERRSSKNFSKENYDSNEWKSMKCSGTRNQGLKIGLNNENSSTERGKIFTPTLGEPLNNQSKKF